MESNAVAPSSATPAATPAAAARHPTTTLVAREDVAEGTVAFRFTKPPGFSFRAGQAVDLLLKFDGAAKPKRHAFSVASAPFEDGLVLATRMRDSAYKRALGALVPGAAAAIDGPFGTLTLHRSPVRDAVLVAGGIGITPFRSMLRQARHDGETRRFTLVYSNRRPEDAAFLEELVRLERDFDRFRLVATMTDMGKSTQHWDGRRVMVDAAMIAHAADGMRKPVYYVVGPPAMVAAVRATLETAGIEEEDIRLEEFYGY